MGHEGSDSSPIKASQQQGAPTRRESSLSGHDPHQLVTTPIQDDWYSLLFAFIQGEEKHPH